jgi:hypothetical protein
MRTEEIITRLFKYLTARLDYLAVMFNTLLEMAEGELAIAQFSL